MKLYYHPASTTSRAVLLFAAEQKIALELQAIDGYVATLDRTAMVPV